MAGIAVFGHDECVGDFGGNLLDGGQADAVEFHVQKADVKRGVVDDEFGILQKIGDLLANLLKSGGIVKLVECDAVNATGFFGNVALRVYVKMQTAACEPAVNHF